MDVISLVAEGILVVGELILHDWARLSGNEMKNKKLESACSCSLCDNGGDLILMINFEKCTTCQRFVCQFCNGDENCMLCKLFDSHSK